MPSPSLALRPATPSDAPAIATIWITAFDNPSDPINRVKYGTADRKQLIDFITLAVRRELEAEEIMAACPYLVIVQRGGGAEYGDGGDEGDEVIVSYAQWERPRHDGGSGYTSGSLGAGKDKDKGKGGVEGEDQEGEVTRGVYDGGPEGMRFDFFPGYYAAGRKLMRDAVQGRPCFHLCNLATHPDHHRKGAASLLMRWALDQADAQGVIAYLDTNIDGMGKPFYERLGFKVVGRHEFDLERFGGEGKDSLVAMVRWPRELRL